MISCFIHYYYCKLSLINHFKTISSPIQQLPSFTLNLEAIKNKLILIFNLLLLFNHYDHLHHHLITKMKLMLHSSHFFILFIFLFLFNIFEPCFAHYRDHKDLIDAPLLTSKLSTNRTIIVSQKGKDHFTSIQDAINSVSDDNSKWIIIHLRPGVYR